MNPLFALGTVAAGVFMATRKKEEAPVAPEVVEKATGLARSFIARGATPEQAAELAAEKVAETGGGFWKDESRRSRRTDTRF
jgi:hypothetical protein